MVKPTDIHPLSNFVRDPKSHIKRLAETGRAEVLTVNGRASVIVQDVAAYEKLLDEVDYWQTVKLLEERLAAVKAGEPGIPFEQARETLKKIARGEAEP